MPLCIVFIPVVGIISLIAGFALGYVMAQHHAEEKKK
jgi:uncharacterized protein YneF (UPF0154 family)